MTHTFTPGPETERGFRDALGRFATGVTVITTQSAIGPLGITANSFASVSLEPPLVLWSPAKKSRRFRSFAETQYYAIHILAVEQASVAQRFSRDGTDFDGLAWHPGEHGVPLIADCPACFECTPAGRMDGGDHVVLLGRVVRCHSRDGRPLVFSQGQMGSFSEA